MLILQCILSFLALRPLSGSPLRTTLQGENPHSDRTQTAFNKICKNHYLLQWLFSLKQEYFTIYLLLDIVVTNFRKFLHLRVPQCNGTVSWYKTFLCNADPVMSRADRTLCVQQQHTIFPILIKSTLYISFIGFTIQVRF